MESSRPSGGLDTIMMKEGGSAAFARAADCSESSVKAMRSRAALILLGEEWSEKIEKAKGEERLIILKNYEKARDQVCSRIGLAGLAEYNWITNVAVKDSSNADVFAKAGLKL